MEHTSCGRRKFISLIFVVLVCLIWSLFSYHTSTISNDFFDNLRAPGKQDHYRGKGDPENTTLTYKTSVTYQSRTLDKPVFIKNVTEHDFTVTYETCIHIPKSPPGKQWAEEQFIDDPPLTDLIRTVSPAHCTVRLKGPDVVNLGDKVRVRIELFDGYGNQRKGGDLVRVWMKEESLDAGSVAKVTDHMNGTYDAEFLAFWVGRPEVKAAIISPREVIALQFKRRYTCPPVLMNSGDFEGERDITENTPCSYYPQIPGFTEICNLTGANYGRPWYCGKPRSKDLSCANWTKASDRMLSDQGFESHIFSSLENDILTRKYQAMIIPTNITVKVKSGDGKLTTPIPDLKCNSPDRRHTWLTASPTGYLYNKQWTVRSCTGRNRNQTLVSCLNNTKMILIGDSTVRQMFKALSESVTCNEGAPNITRENKHTLLTCEVPAMNYTLEVRLHELPFCTTKNPLRYLKPLSAQLRPFHHSDGSKIVVVYHVFAHFVNYHSHVFLEGMKAMKVAIIQLLNANPNARVILKGPHSYAFELNNKAKFINFPEGYMEVYEGIIKDVFKDVQDKVAYLDVADITIATEQASIHPEEYVVKELNNRMLDLICPY